MKRLSRSGPALYNSVQDKILDAAILCISALLMVITLYPVLYTAGLSFSGKLEVENGLVWLCPVGFTLDAYKLVFKHPLIPLAYLNTILYTLVGTFYSLALTVVGGYVLSRRTLPGRNMFMFIITFTMLFSGGLIPTFMVISQMGLFDTFWALIIPCAISPWNLIIMRTSMQSIPASLEESAKIDGANYWTVFWRIFLPLSKSVVATIGLFYAVGKWNDYFNALIYLNNQRLFPVQLVIRALLTGMDAMNTTATNNGVQMVGGSTNYTPVTFKAAVVVVTMLPILCVYPFIQKYFVKGVMVGAIKG